MNFIRIVLGIKRFNSDRRSANKVHLGLWQSVKVQRFDRIGSIQLNNGTIVKGTSGPPLNELNLELPLYIGGVP